MISVIIPAYNAEKTIVRAIQSVQNQSYNDFEIIVVNDGSIDSTKDICEEYVRNNSRIRIINKKNGGLSSARNAGIREAQGELISFLDSDDEYLPYYLEKMHDAIAESDADIVVCGYCSVFPDGRNILSDTFSTVITLNKDEAIRELIIGLRLSSHAWNKLYRKDIISNIVYPEGKVYEDLYVMPDILDACSKICFIPDRLVKYYQIDSSITHKFTLKKEYDAFNAAYRRYLLYKNEFCDYYSYLVREPTEIALRIYSKKRTDLGDAELFDDIECAVEDFLKEVHKNKKTYIYLRKKYKCLLLLYRFMKGRIR